MVLNRLLSSKTIQWRPGRRHGLEGYFAESYMGLGCGMILDGPFLPGSGFPFLSEALKNILYE